MLLDCVAIGVKWLKKKREQEKKKEEEDTEVLS